MNRRSFISRTIGGIAAVLTGTAWKATDPLLVVSTPEGDCDRVRIFRSWVKSVRHCRWEERWCNTENEEWINIGIVPELPFDASKGVISVSRIEFLQRSIYDRIKAERQHRTCVHTNG